MSVCFLGLIVSLTVTWFVSCFAGKVGLLDVPSARSSHYETVPKGGGLGILLSVIIYASLKEGGILLLWPAIALSLMSLAGDRYDISPWFRLGGQFLFATIFIYSFCINISANRYVFDTGVVEPLLLKAVLLFGSVVYIVGTANFYNFMDGINGISGITGIIAFSFLAAFGVVSGQEGFWVLLDICLIGACMGFLPLNIPKAKVFMGDVGSILLGFLFAMQSIIFSGTLQDFVVICCFLFPFYADELITMFERVREGHNLSKPHRCHLYQILANEANVAHWKVSTCYGFVQVAVGVSVWIASFLWGVWAAICVFIAYFLIVTALSNSLKARFSITT